jgi:hypothetical protein
MVIEGLDLGAQGSLDLLGPLGDLLAVAPDRVSPGLDLI